MIKFFRNIRKKIIEENKSVIKNTNYVKYALGEIILVVLGILIALQINTWNENIKDTDLYYSYLLRLKEDFTDILHSTEEAKTIEQRLTGLGDLVLDVCLNKNDTVNPIKLAIAIDYTAGRHFYTKSSQTWTDLISTGNLKLIENKTLRNEIGKYNNLIDQRNFQIEEWFRFKTQYRDLTRDILKPEERLLIALHWVDVDVENPEYKNTIVTTFNEMKTKLQSKPDLNSVLTDVLMTRKITTDMMGLEIENINKILEIIDLEIDNID